ncbi:MAG: DeoR/GlpR family DNA-binding transcription regulator, partial [Bacteroidota bacterium]
MLREERLKKILTKLEQDSRVSSTDLMHEFQVSEGTIRRDLNELEGKGLLQKVHGGAIPRPEAPSSLDGRMAFASDKKALLARKAIPLLQEGQLILIDGGSTNWHIARQIPRNLPLTVFTNSVLVVQELLDYPLIDLHFLGGRVFKSSQVTLGAEVIEALNQIHPDLCFVGIRSIHPKLGVSTLNREEALVKKRMVERSSQSVVLATADKLHTVDHFTICSVNELDLILVEDEVDKELLRPFHQ